MTSRTTGITGEDPGVVSHLVWDVSSNLVATTGASGSRVYLYDASGQRVAQVRLDDTATANVYEGTATAYFGATEVTDVSTAPAVLGDLAGTRYYTFGGATVAVRQTAPATAATLSLVLGDFQGSAEVMMPLHVNGTGALVLASAQDATDARLTRNLYAPYGAVRGTGTPAQNDKLTISKGWLNQVTDEASTGLVYLNARYYDPAAGRFISPDPKMNPSDPKTLDPYRYADNNPISFTDATGFCAAGESLGYVYNGTTMEHTCYYIKNLPAAIATMVQNNIGGKKSYGTNCGRGKQFCTRTTDFNKLLPFTPITLKQAFGYNKLLDQYAADRQVQRQRMSGVDVVANTLVLTAYAVTAEDAVDCASAPGAGSCSLAVVGMIPGGKSTKGIAAALHLGDDAAEAAIKGVDDLRAPKQFDDMLAGVPKFDDLTKLSNANANAEAVRRGFSNAHAWKEEITGTNTGLARWDIYLDKGGVAWLADKSHTVFAG